MSGKYPPLPTPRLCKDCGRLLDKSNFKRQNRGKTCIDCNRLRMRNWVVSNRDSVIISTKRYQSTSKFRDNQNRWARLKRRNRKHEVINHYSNGTNMCESCGFCDIRALTIDHVDGGGCKHRRDIGITSGWGFYKWLIDNGFPEGFQVLCANCQSIKRHTNEEGVVNDE